MSSSNNSSSNSGGIGFTGLLTVAFVVLKLTNVIDWSWWWVLSPIWIVTGLVLFILAGIFAWAIIKK
jgi:fatty acid desaturase